MNDTAPISLTYTDRQRHTHTHTSSHSKTNTLSLHYTCTLYLLLLLCQCTSLSPYFFPLCFTLHYLSIYSVLLSLPPSLPLAEQPSDGLVPFHNSWSCSYGSGSHVGCESVRLKGSLSLHRLSQEGYCSSCCAQVAYSTKSTRSITPGSYSTCKFSAFVKAPQTLAPFCERQWGVFLCSQPWG